MQQSFAVFCQMTHPDHPPEVEELVRALERIAGVGEQKCLHAQPQDLQWWQNNAHTQTTRSCLASFDGSPLAAPSFPGPPHVPESRIVALRWPESRPSFVDLSGNKAICGDVKRGCLLPWRWKAVKSCWEYWSTKRTSTWALDLLAAKTAYVLDFMRKQNAISGISSLSICAVRRSIEPRRGGAPANGTARQALVKNRLSVKVEIGSTNGATCAARHRCSVRTVLRSQGPGGVHVQQRPLRGMVSDMQIWSLVSLLSIVSLLLCVWGPRGFHRQQLQRQTEVKSSTSSSSFT